MDATVELKTTCSPANVRKIATIVEATLRASISDETRAAVEIALSEACVNIVKHGSEGDESLPLSVRLDVTNESVRLTIVDRGVSFDPREHQGLSIEDHLPSEIPTSGRGLLLIHELIDEIGYEVENGNNVLTLTKNLATAHAEPANDAVSEETETQSAT